MDKISTCRAAYMIPFLDVLRDIGAPVERELAKAKLPTMIEEMPEEFIINNCLTSALVGPNSGI